MDLTILAVVKAILARGLFISVGYLCVRSLVDVEKNPLYWFMLSTAVLSIFEATITLTTRKGGEWTWFYPSFAIALLSTVPAIWILELDIMERHIEAADRLGLDTCTDAILHTNDSYIDGVGNFTPEEWSLLLQQVLLFTLILGRWMLPKGSMTRDQLSQLLLVFIGIAADILEFSTESLKLSIVRCDDVMVVTILSLWTWSLMQFTLGLTVTKSRKPKVAGVTDRRENVNQVCEGGCCETETWGILVTIIMQDGPFFAMRMYLIFHESVVNQGMIFFTCKNLMVLLLQMYRLLVLYCEKPTSGPPNTFVRVVQKTRTVFLAIQDSNKDRMTERERSSRNPTDSMSVVVADVEPNGNTSISDSVMADVETNNISQYLVKTRTRDETIVESCFVNHNLNPDDLSRDDYAASPTYCDEMFSVQ